MGSLQDQLLKAGLVNKQQLRQAKSKKHKARKGKGKKAAAQGEPSLAAAYAARAKEEKVQRDRELNQRREEARRRRELKARLRQIILASSQNDKAADVPRHFQFGGKIRRIYTTKPQQSAINSGRLGIAYHAGRYHVVDAATIARIGELDEGAVAYFASSDGGDSDAADGYDDDRFKVPDDLIW